MYCSCHLGVELFDIWPALLFKISPWIYFWVDDCKCIEGISFAKSNSGMLEPTPQHTFVRNQGLIRALLRETNGLVGGSHDFSMFCQWKVGKLSVHLGTKAPSVGCGFCYCCGAKQSRGAARTTVRRLMFGENFQQMIGLALPETNTPEKKNGWKMIFLKIGV